MTIPVFYDPRMAVDADTYSPSAAKPKLVVDDWLKHDMPIRVIQPEPWLPTKCHPKAYIDGVMNGTVPNGFGNHDTKVSASLLWTNGALMSAVRHVCTTSDHVAVAPASGFHHARWAHGSGFCTFNGLVGAAMEAADYLKRAAILDCDYHYGDGTDDILDRLDPRRLRVRHYSAGLRYRDPRMGARFLADLPNILDTLVSGGVSVVLYQAGADQHANDPLGGLLTTSQMMERDRIVFQALRHKRVVWTLAGGYQRDADGSIPAVLRLHRNTLEACLEAFGVTT